MNKKLLILFFIIFSLNLFAQDNSASKIDSLKQVLVKTKVNDIEKLNSYLELTKIFIHKNIDLSIVYAEKGKLLAEKNSNSMMIANFLIEYARIKEVQNDFEASLDHLDEAVKLYEDLDKDYTFIKVLNYQGMYYEMLSNYDMSIEKYLQGIALCNDLDIRMSKATFLINLSLVYSKVDQFEESLASILEATLIHVEIGSRNQYNQSLIYVGNSYINLGKYDLAKENLNKAKIFFEERNDYILLEDIYASLGKISRINGNWEESLELLVTAQRYALIMKDYNGSQQYKLALINNSLGDTYLDFKNYSQAIKSFRSSEEIGEKLNSLEVLKNSYKGLAYCYLNLKNTDSTNHYLNLFIPVNNNLLEEQYNEKIDLLNYDYQLEIEQNKFVVEKKLIESKKKNQKIFFISIVSILSLIILVIVFFWYILKTKYQKTNLLRKTLRLEKERLTLDLETKNKELTATLLNLIERNKFISKISENLEQLKSNENEGDLVKIERMISEIDMDLTKNLWKEFEMTYVKVHKEFFSKLSNISTALTANETRLCALIKLNMSTKDISSITYQSEQSIKIARYRLRKKLGLIKNENLTLFLHNI